LYSSIHNQNYKGFNAKIINLLHFFYFSLYTSKIILRFKLQKLKFIYFFFKSYYIDDIILICSRISLYVLFYVIVTVYDQQFLRIGWHNLVIHGNLNLIHKKTLCVVA